MSVIQPRTSVVTIYQGDYLDQIRHVEQKYEAALKAETSGPPRTLNETLASIGLAEEHQLLFEQAESTALHVTVKSLGWRRYDELLLEHPPREDNEGDIALGANESTLRVVLVPLSIVSPELTDDDLDALSSIDWDRLFWAAWALNKVPPTSPKALEAPGSQESPESDAN